VGPIKVTPATRRIRNLGILVRNCRLPRLTWVAEAFPFGAVLLARDRARGGLYELRAVFGYKVGHMKRSVVILSAFALLGASCSSEASTASGHAVSPPTQQTPASKPIAHVGDALNLMRIGEQKITVTLLQVINPATVPNGWGDAGKTYIATKLKITNAGTSSIVGNTNSDVSVVGSDKQSYRADFATVTECKDFVDGWFLLAAGASTTGCVVFKLPQGVTSVKVKYAPSSGISHDVGEWLNP
jgi:hypothetical protein